MYLSVYISVFFFKNDIINFRQLSIFQFIVYNFLLNWIISGDYKFHKLCFVLFFRLWIFGFKIDKLYKDTKHKWSVENMGSQFWDILRQGIWASFTGGWYYEPKHSIFTNTFHLYLWLILLCLPFFIHLVIYIFIIILFCWMINNFLFYHCCTYYFFSIYQICLYGYSIQVL